MGCYYPFVFAVYCVELDCLGEPWCTAWVISSENKAKSLEIRNSGVFNVSKVTRN